MGLLSSSRKERSGYETSRVARGVSALRGEKGTSAGVA